MMGLQNFTDLGKTSHQIYFFYRWRNWRPREGNDGSWEGWFNTFYNAQIILFYFSSFSIPNLDTAKITSKHSKQMLSNSGGFI